MEILNQIDKKIKSLIYKPTMLKMHYVNDHPKNILFNNPFKLFQLTQRNEPKNL